MTTPELLAAVRAWAAVHYPSCPLEYITIHLRYLPVPVQLAEGPSVAPGVAQEASSGEKGPGIHRCTRDILRTLREAGKPLTKTRLLEEMERLGFEWSESMVCRRLAEMMSDGTLENPDDARPRGYRLPAGG
jgi:hypothetical protein